MESSSKNKKIFISHATNDKKIASDIVKKLIEFSNFSTEDIFCTSIELCNIEIGNKWIEEIDHNLGNCKYFLMLCSKDSINSKFVWYEFGFVKKRHPEVKIIPIIIDLKAEELDQSIGIFQHIKYENGWVNQLISSITDTTISKEILYNWDRFNSSLDELKKLFDNNAIINVPQINLNAKYRNIFDRLIKEGQVSFTTNDDGYIGLTRYNLPHNLILELLGAGYYEKNCIYYMRFISDSRINPEFEKLLLNPKCKFSPNSLSTLT